jgi:hypothetical protein
LQRYGHAGAIELFRKEHQLPRVISTHNNYFLWGAGEPTPQILIAMGSNPRDLQVVRAGRARGDHSRDLFHELAPEYAYLRRQKAKGQLSDVWSSFKNFG